MEDMACQGSVWIFFILWVRIYDFRKPPLSVLLLKKRMKEETDVKDRKTNVEFVLCNTGGYRDRTIRNVQDTDGTLIFAIDTTTAGERLTKWACREYKKPVLEIILSYSSSSSSTLSTCNGVLGLNSQRDTVPKLIANLSPQQIDKWLNLHSIKTLNIAGNSLQR